MLFVVCTSYLAYLVWSVNCHMWIISLLLISTMSPDLNMHFSYISPSVLHSVVSTYMYLCHYYSLSLSLQTSTYKYMHYSYISSPVLHSAASICALCALVIALFTVYLLLLLATCVYKFYCLANVYIHMVTCTVV